MDQRRHQYGQVVKAASTSLENQCLLQFLWPAFLRFGIWQCGN